MSWMQATVSPMMQTVIRWRRPSDIETTRYPASTNACNYLLRNALCYIISGTLLLVVGVIITSLTFQNLDGSLGENKERYAGPVLIAAGVLVMARGAFSRLWSKRTTMASRRRSLLRRYISEIYSRPIIALENSSTFSLCDMDVSDLYNMSSGGRMYNDDPPSYEVVTSNEYNPCRDHPYVHAYSNPANDVEDEDEVIILSDGPIPIVITPVPDLEPSPSDIPDSYGPEAFGAESCEAQHYESESYVPQSFEPEPYEAQPYVREGYDPEPPPSYYEYIQSEQMKTTRL